VGGLTQLALALDEPRVVVRHPAEGETVAGCTVRSIARTTRLRPQEAQQLLDELGDAGIAEEIVVGVWRLSGDGERRYGAAFRGLHGWLEAGSV